MENMANPETPSPALRLPDHPAVVLTVRGTLWLSPDGEIETFGFGPASDRLMADIRPYVCHGRAMARKLGIRPFPALDVLELFAFVRPARFCLPTPRGLAAALGLPIPVSHEDEAALLPEAAGALLRELSAAADRGGDEHDNIRRMGDIMRAMDRGGWPWGPAALAAMNVPADHAREASRDTLSGLKVWRRLPEWEEGAPDAPPGNMPVEPVEARARLVQLLGSGSEKREQQTEYASSAAHAFLPREHVDVPHVVVAEAGTGIGKTLGYVAPASVWAEKNRGSVWISTFTRNLQRQLDAELDRLHPDPQEKSSRVVLRKGRENYLCLLNFEEAVNRIATAGGATAIPLGLMARWASASRDGDMIGGDFPAWLGDLMGRNLTLDLTDTRGECLYSACSHYQKCFIEHTQRRARRADIVVANHALVMVHAALGGDENAADGSRPTRYVFDEAHHLFEAADSAFAAHLSGQETADLRRWLIGPEAGSRSRSRGLKTRLGDLIAGDDDATKALDDVLHGARALASGGWASRLGSGGAQGPTEAFLAVVRQQVYARDRSSDGPYSLETETHPPVDGLMEAARTLEAALDNLLGPLNKLLQALASLLDREAETLETADRVRIEAAMRSISRRGVMAVSAWRDMLRCLGAETPEQFVDWFGVERRGGHDWDVGLYRHWVDPTEPFADTVLEPAHGVLMTSATLSNSGMGRGVEDDALADGLATGAWRTGASHLAVPPMQERFPSPFDYTNQTRIIIVNDVSKTDNEAIASAYRVLFEASGGGALGLFTAIARLRKVYQRIAEPLDARGVPLLAQHVDPIDTGTLVDIFRAEENACLLGTDAVRDGVDVPGRSLRLIVFDRVPWPRPDILHKARRARFGGKVYDEMLTRLRLKQAYGRLIRRATDHGVFVMLDRSTPTRLLDAFPEGVTVERTGLANAAAMVRDFLGDVSV